MIDVGVDTETQDERVWCMGISDGKSRSATTDWHGTWDQLRGMPVFQNASFDLKHITQDGGKMPSAWIDVILEAHMLGIRPLSLDKQSEVMLNIPLDKTFVKQRKKVRYEQRPDEVLAGCSLDAYAAVMLHRHYAPQLKPRWKELVKREQELTPVIIQMEQAGLPVSREKLKKARTTILQKMGPLENRLAEIGLTSPGDTELIGQKFWRGKKRIVTTKDGSLSTAKDVLREHATPEERPWVEQLLEWRQLDKFRTTYVEKWSGKDRIRASINPTGADTWRWSVSDPNLQNVSKSKVIPLFHLFEAPEGWTFISADASQVELRVLAIAAHDEPMLRLYKAGGDMHDDTVARLTKMGVFENRPDIMQQAEGPRRFAKTLNFGIPYGMGGETYAKRTGMRTMITHTRWGKPLPRDQWYMGPDAAAGDEFVNGWYVAHPAVRKWQNEQIQFCLDHGYVETFEGRPLWIPGIYGERGRLYHHAEKQCGNFPIQGGALELVKDAILRAPKYLVMQVHDELLYLVPKREAKDYEQFLHETLPDKRFEIPITWTIHSGDSWGDIKNIEDIWEEEDEDGD